MSERMIFLHDGETFTRDVTMEGREYSERLAYALMIPHIESPECWCAPTIEFTDSKSGLSVFVHHEPN